MNKYKEYMDSVEVSTELHARLTHLVPAKRPAPWKKYGALAAALMLVVGAGAFGLSRLGEIGTGPATAEIAEEEPDIAVDTDPEGHDDGQPQTSGGYEVTEGEVVSYYMLPYIAYGEGAADSSSLIDFAYNAPEGSIQREVTAADVAALAWGEDALTVHLGWGGCTLQGEVIVNEDGSLWHMYVGGEREDMAFFLDVLAGDELPPNCIVTATDTVTDVWGVPVKGYRGGIYGLADEDGDTILWLPESRTVEFVANGAGYRFQVYGQEGQGEAVELLVSRFVRMAVGEGLNLSLNPEKTASAVPAAEGNSGDTPACDPAQPQIWN